MSNNNKTTTVTVQLHNLTLKLGKKNYAYTADLLCNNAPLKSYSHGASISVKADTDNTVVPFQGDAKGGPLTFDVPNHKIGESSLTLSFTLNSRKSASSVKKYDKTQSVSVGGIGPGAAITVVFGDIGSITFSVLAQTAEQLALLQKQAEDAWRMEEIRKAATLLEQKMMKEREPMEKYEKAERDTLKKNETAARKKAATATSSSAAAANRAPSSPPASPRGAAPAAAAAASSTTATASSSSSSPTVAGRNNTATASSSASAPAPAAAVSPPPLTAAEIKKQQEQKEREKAEKEKEMQEQRRKQQQLQLQQQRKDFEEDESNRRDDIEMEERAAVGIMKASAGAAEKKLVAGQVAFQQQQQQRRKSPRHTEPRKPPTPLQILQQQQVLIRDRIAHEERVAFLQLRAAQGGDKRRRTILEEQLAAERAEFDSSSATSRYMDTSLRTNPYSPVLRRQQQRIQQLQQQQQQQRQQSPGRQHVDPRLRDPNYYLGARAMTMQQIHQNEAVLQELEKEREQLVYEQQQQHQQQQSQQQRYYSRQQGAGSSMPAMTTEMYNQQQPQQHEDPPVVIGGMMLARDRATAPRSRELPFSSRMQQQQDRGAYSPYSSSSSRPVSPRHEMREDLRQLRTQQRMQQEEEERQQQQQQQYASSSSSPPFVPGTSVWERLVGRCHYAPQLTEHELVGFEWITLRDLAREVGFTDRDDVIDIYETWRAKNKALQHQQPSRQQQQQISSSLSRSRRSASPSSNRNNASSPGNFSPRLQPRSLRQQQTQHQQQQRLEDIPPRQRAEAVAAAVLPPPPEQRRGGGRQQQHQQQQQQLVEYAPADEDGRNDSSLLMYVSPARASESPTPSRGSRRRAPRF